MRMVNKAYSFDEEATTSFSDVKSTAWYAPEVAKAKAAGYIKGYEDGTMRPNNPITRQEAAVIIMRLNRFTADASAANIFNDAANMPSWSKGAIGATVNARIFGGYPDGTFKGGNFITRAEAVVALDRAKPSPARP